MAGLRAAGLRGVLADGARPILGALGPPGPWWPSLAGPLSRGHSGLLWLGTHGPAAIMDFAEMKSK